MPLPAAPSNPETLLLTAAAIRPLQPPWNGKQKHKTKQERKAKHRELEQQLAERQEELARLGVEEQSLVRVKAEQEALLARLTESGGGGAF
jgi:acyl-CoA reductase-like NAD-dependent aldehyde dehydrogenase